jgi:thioredoxin 2
MTETVHVVCPHCDRINRVPNERLVSTPRCGHCHDPLFVTHPLPLDQERFDLHVSRNEIPILVDFWASWCAPCRAMAPIFEQAASSLEPHVRLVKVNTEEERGLAARYAIRSIPTLILFRNEREVARNSGAMDLARLLAWTRQYV